MKTVIENLAALIKVKTLATLLVALLFCVMALRGDFTPEAVLDIVKMVFMFYFGSQVEKIAQKVSKD